MNLVLISNKLGHIKLWKEILKYEINLRQVNGVYKISYYFPCKFLNNSFSYIVNLKK